MSEDDIKKKLRKDPEFVFSKRYDYSIVKLEERYPDGAPNNVIANVLMLSEAEVEEEYQRVVVKMRGSMGVEV